jgi:very-short-patch-repair endonuclease
MQPSEGARERTASLAAKGYRVLRFWNNDVMNYLDGVVKVVLDALG